jgi:hypothetical protein
MSEVTLQLLRQGSGVTIDGDLRMNSTSSDLDFQINADTDVGGQGQFVLCGALAVHPLLLYYSQV